MDGFYLISIEGLSGSASYSAALSAAPGVQTAPGPAPMRSLSTQGTVEIDQDFGVQVVDDGIQGDVAPRPDQTAGAAHLGTSIEGLRITTDSASRPGVAVGTDHLLAVVPGQVAWWSKTHAASTDDVAAFRSPEASFALADFFGLSAEPDLPVAAFDSFVGRFVVAAVDNGNTVALAVSDSSDPNGVWYHDTVGTVGETIEDLSLAVADGVLYLAAELSDDASGDLSAELWALDVWTDAAASPGDAPTGFYHGGDLDASAANVWGVSVPTLPMVTAAATASGDTTYLVHYNGSEDSSAPGEEILTIIEVTDPTGSFTRGSPTEISLGDIDDTSFGDLPEAPQLNEPTTAHVGDRRAANAYYDGTYLYTAVATAATDLDQWAEPSIQVLRVKLSDHTVDRVEIDGEDIGDNVYVYNPAIAVDSNGVIGVVYNASNPSLDIGTYLTVVTDIASGATTGAQALAAGQDGYDRTANNQNAFSDTSAVAVDPAGVHADTFWALGAYALPAAAQAVGGTSTSQWGTRWGNFAGTQGDGTGLSGIVYLDADADNTRDDNESGISRATVSLYEDNGDGAADPTTDTLVTVTQSDQFGHYGFFGLTPGTDYFVEVDPGNLRFSGSRSGTVGADGLSAVDTADNLDGVEAPISVNTLSGFAFRDRDQDALWETDDEESGVEGVTVELYLYDGAGDPNPDEDTLLATTTTDADGAYTFFAQGQSAGDAPSTSMAALDDGDYVVAFSQPANMTFGAADAGDDTIDSDASYDDDARAWTPVVSLAGALTEIGLALENSVSLAAIVEGIKGFFNTLDQALPILDEATELPYVGEQASQVIALAETGSDIASRLEAFASVSPGTLSTFDPGTDLNFSIRVAAGDTVPISIDASALSGNTSASDLVDDLNDALADAGLDALLEATVEGDSFAISAIDDSASGTVALSLLSLAATPPTWGQPGADLSFDVDVETVVTSVADDGTETEAFSTETFAISLPVAADSDDDPQTEDNASLADLVIDLNAVFSAAGLTAIQAFDRDGELVFAATDPDVTDASFGDISALGFSGSSLVEDAGALAMGLEPLRGLGGLKFETLDELEAVLLEALVDVSDGALPEGFDLGFDFDTASNVLTFNLGLVKSFSEDAELDFSDGLPLGELGTIELTAAASATFSIDLTLALTVGISLADQAAGLELDSDTALADLNDGAGVPILVGITATSATPASLSGSFDFDLTLSGGDYAGTHTVQYVHDTDTVFFDAYDVAAVINDALADVSLDDDVTLADFAEFFFDGAYLNVWAIDDAIIQLDISGASTLGFGTQTSDWPDLVVNVWGTETELTLDGLETVGEVLDLFTPLGVSATADAESASISIDAGASELSIGAGEAQGNSSLAAFSLGILGTASLNDDGDYVLDGTHVHGQSSADRFFIVADDEANLELAIRAEATDIELGAAIGSIGVALTDVEDNPFIAELALPISLIDPASEADDGFITVDEIVAGSFDSLIEIGDLTADISGCLQLEAELFADILDGPLAELCVGLGTPNELSSVAFTTDTSGFEEAVGQLRNLSFEQIYLLVQSFVDTLKASDGAMMNATLPVLERSPAELLDFLDRLLDGFGEVVFAIDLDAVDSARDNLDNTIGNLPIDLELKAGLFGAVDSFHAITIDHDWDGNGDVNDDDDNDGRRLPRLLAALGDMRLAIEPFLPDGADLATLEEADVDAYTFEMVQAYLSLADLVPTFDSFAELLQAAINDQMPAGSGITITLDLIPDFDGDEGTTDYGAVLGIAISQDDLLDSGDTFEPELPSADLGPIDLETDGGFGIHGGGSLALTLAFNLSEMTGDAEGTGVYVVVTDDGGYTPTALNLHLGFDGGFEGDVALGGMDLVGASAELSLLSAVEETQTVADSSVGLDYTPRFGDDSRFILVDDSSGALQDYETITVSGADLTFASPPAGDVDVTYQTDDEIEARFEDRAEDPDNRASLTIGFDDGSEILDNALGAIPFSDLFTVRTPQVDANGMLVARMDVELLTGSAELLTLAFDMDDIADLDLSDPLAGVQFDFNENVLSDLLANIEFDLRTIVAGISALLDFLEAGLTSDVMANLPVIGSGLDMTGTFLGHLDDHLVEPFEDFLDEVGGSFEDVEFITKLYIWNALGDPAATGTVSGDALAYLGSEEVRDLVGYTGSFAGIGLIKDFNHLHVEMDSDYFEIALDIEGEDDLAGASFDSGLDGLPISVDAGIDVTVDYAFTFGVGVHKASGFYLVTKDSATDGDVHFGIEAGLTGDEHNPSSFDFDLFGLRLSAEDKWEDVDADPDLDHTSVGGTVDLFINAATLAGFGSSGTYSRHSANDLADTSFADLFDLDVEAQAILNLQATAAINSNLPSVSTGLWALVDIELSYSGGELVTDLATDFSFHEVEIDLGDFLSTYLGPAIQTVNDYLEPIRPIIDLLTAEVPGVSEISQAAGGGKITMIDLALAQKPDAAQNAKKFLAVVAAISDVIEAVDAASSGDEVRVSLGSLDIGSINDDDWNETENTSGLSLIDVGASAVDSQVAGSSNSAMASAFATIEREPDSQGLGGLGIGLEFLDPANIFAYLMGQTATVITWDIPRLDLGFEWGMSFRPVPTVPPLVVTVGLNASMFVDLSVGYDTRGVATGNFFDGFFFGDLEEVDQGSDIDEFGFGLGVSVGAGLDVGVASAGIEGEIRGDVFANWRDTDDDGKLYLDELARIISQDGVDCLFDWRAEISAIIRVVWEVLGIEGSLDIIDVIIAEFDSEGHCPKFTIAHVADSGDSDQDNNLPNNDGTAEDGTLVIHTGHFAGERQPGSSSDTSETVTVTRLAPEVYTVEGMGLEQQFGGVKRIYFDGGEGTDTLDFDGVDPEVEVVAYGGDGVDILLGGSQVDYLSGGGGDDAITGEGSGDFLYGGAGIDIIDGGAGADTIEGGSENDTITGGSEDDDIWGGSGDDDIWGNGGDDEIWGDEGDDEIYGADGEDVIEGGSGDDYILGDVGDDEIYGNAGADDIQGQDGADYIDGGSGNDVIFGDDNPDDDVADGASPGADEIYGDEGHDLVYAGAGDDFIFAGDGNDLVVGQGGVEYIFGGWGNDILIAHEIGDVSTIDAGHHIEGGPDDDFICGADGADIIYGGSLEASHARPISADDFVTLDQLDLLDGTVPVSAGGYGPVSCVEEETPFLLLSLPATVSGQKFEDLNDNGVWDEGEQTLDGWTIELYDDNGDLVEAVETADGGHYSFAVDDGSYTIREVDQDGYRQSTDDHQLEIAGISTDTYDVGNLPLGTIEGRKWHDLDKDGYYDRADEPGIAGILVFVDYDGNGVLDEETEPYAETQSDNAGTAAYEAGLYSIANVEPGAWQVVEVLDYTGTTLVEGVHMYAAAIPVVADIAGSDWAPTFPTTGDQWVLVQAALTVEDINFGNVKAAEVTGGKYADENSNGVRDFGEAGLWGVRIYDDANNNGVLDDGEDWVYTVPDDPATLDNEAGTFRLGSLGPGVHNIREEIPAGFSDVEIADTVRRGIISGSHHELDLSTGEAVEADFINDPDGGVTDGQKFEDANHNGIRDPGETGISGITVFADYDRDGELDADEPWTVSRDYDFNRDGEIDPETEAGWYRLTGLPVGVHRIAESAADYAMLAPPAGLSIIEFGGVVTETLMVGGFAGLWAGTEVGDEWSIRYVVDMAAVDHIASPHRGLYNAVRAYALTIDGRTFGGAVSGAAAQVRVFENHPNGVDQYELTLPVLAGPFVAVLQLDDTTETALPDDSQPPCGKLSLTDFDFRHFTLRDVVYDAAINASVTWHRCTSDDGIYVDITDDDDVVPGTDLPNQEATKAIVPLDPTDILPDHSDIFVPAREIVVVDHSRDDVSGRGTISGAKWSDANRNGTWDGDEDPLAGVTIYLDQNNNGVLDDGELSTVTDEDGNYAFTGLDDGVYVVREVVPDDGEQTYPNRRLFDSRWEGGVYEYLFDVSAFSFYDHQTTLIGVAASPVDGLLYALDDDGVLYAYDTFAKTKHTVGTLTVAAGEGDIAFDPTNGVLHLVRGLTGYLQTIEIAYGDDGLPSLAGTSPIGFTGISDPSGLAFQSTGELFVLDSAGALHELDKTTGAVIADTVIDFGFGLGVSSSYVGAAFDPLNDDYLYYAYDTILYYYDFAQDRGGSVANIFTSDDFSGLTFLRDDAHVLEISDQLPYFTDQDFGNYIKIVVPDGDDLIHAWGDDDLIYGDNVVDPVLYISEPGFDELHGGAGADDIYGQEEDDILNGGLDQDAAGGQNDYLDGGLGIDTVFTEKDTDLTLTNTLLVGDGDDTLVSIERGHLVGGAGGYTLDASGFHMGAVHLEGMGGDDILLGGTFGDTLEGGNGSDALNGLAGDDAYVFGDGLLADIDDIAESAGIDTLDFSALTTAIDVDLSGGSATVATYNGRTITSASAADFEIIIGTDHVDHLTGHGSTNNTFSGGLGSDTMDGQGGANTYVFEATSGLEIETVHGGSAADTLDFTAISLDTTVDLDAGSAFHTDRTVALNAVENASTGAGDDTFVNDGSANSFDGGAGNDHYRFVFDSSADTLADSAGADTLDFRDFGAGITIDLTGSTTLIAQDPAGSFTLSGPADAFEILYGSAFADTIDGNDLDNTIYPGLGPDTVNGHAGDDLYIFETLDSDTVNDATGSDTLDLSRLAAGVHVDLSVTSGSVIADDGSGVLSSATPGRFETVLATPYADTLTGNDLDNTLDGGAGHDAYVFVDAASANTDTIVDSSGHNTFDFAALSTGVTVDLAAGTGTAGLTNIVLDAGVEIYDVTGSDHDDLISGNDLDNTLNGGPGNDELFGGKGDDTLLGGADTNTLDGGAGDDTYVLEPALTAIDTLIEDSGRVTAGLAAGGGTDTIDLSALVGVVTIDLSTTAAQTVTAIHTVTLTDSTGATSDYFEDVIGSATAANTLTSNAADNTFTGGASDDAFIFLDAWGADTVVETGISSFDAIDLSAVTTDLNVLVGSLSIYSGGHSLTYSGNRIDELLLGSGDDTVAFLFGASFAGTIDGGSETTADSLDYSNGSLGGFRRLRSRRPMTAGPQVGRNSSCGQSRTGLPPRPAPSPGRRRPPRPYGAAPSAPLPHASTPGAGGAAPYLFLFLLLPLLLQSAPPSLDCPADLFLPCTASLAPDDTGRPAYTTDCPPVTLTHADTPLPGCGGIIRIWSATDACGETATCSQRIELVDFAFPTIECPPDAFVSCGEPTDPSHTGIPTASDNCGAVTLTHTDEPPTFGPDGCEFRRLWTAADRCGNRTRCEQRIVIVGWDRFYGAEADDKPRALAPTPDGYLFAGSVAGAFAAYRVDHAGAVLWHKTYGPGEARAVFAATGGFVLAGHSDGNLRAIKIDPAGTAIWDHTYGPGSLGDAKPAADGGAILAGPHRHRLARRQARRCRRRNLAPGRPRHGCSRRPPSPQRRLLLRRRDRRLYPPSPRRRRLCPLAPHLWRLLLRPPPRPRPPSRRRRPPRRRLPLPRLRRPHRPQPGQLRRLACAGRWRRDPPVGPRLRDPRQRRTRRHPSHPRRQLRPRRHIRRRRSQARPRGLLAHPHRPRRLHPRRAHPRHGHARPSPRPPHRRRRLPPGPGLLPRRRRRKRLSGPWPSPTAPAPTNARRASPAPKTAPSSAATPTTPTPPAGPSPAAWTPSSPTPTSALTATAAGPSCAPGRPATTAATSPAAPRPSPSSTPPHPRFPFPKPPPPVPAPSTPTSPAGAVATDNCGAPTLAYQDHVVDHSNYCLEIVRRWRAQ